MFEVQRFPHDVVMIREADDREEVAFYLVSGSRDAAVIDTGLGGGDLPGLVARLTSCRPVILQTHRHWDHIGASSDFADVRAHAAELAVRRVGWPWEPPDEEGAHSDTDGGMGRSRSGGLVPGVVEVSRSLQHGDRIDPWGTRAGGDSHAGTLSWERVLSGS